MSTDTIPFFFGSQSDVLEHIHDIRKALSEVNRILKPNGVFVFDTINRSIGSYLIHIMVLQNNFLFRYVPEHTHDWRMFITPEELIRAIKDLGMESSIDNFRGLEPILGFPPNPLRSIRPPLLGFKESDSMWGSYLGYAVKN
eukprot:TRINITY_DN6980_c0_g1_i2.p1 TRINITY_DN6980_c0_g1~~TRINITY_DN6980_c0_g1_i2.p1  ORF type:complete len:142 (-),score=30.36 TRINITY_DN6980_c0_g1_i2:78-503(-)